MKVFLLLICVFLATPAFAQDNPESYYRDKFCGNVGGQSEYPLPDGTRVDCLAQNKWAEAIGQSLHYARMTKRQPGIVIVVKTLPDVRFLTRLVNVIVSQGLDIEVIILY
jgi:nucleoside 2-deoxyribosyltransferase